MINSLGDWKLFNRVLPTNSSGPAADAELIGSISAMASNWRSRNHGVISLEHDLYPGKLLHLTPATAAQAPFVIDAIMASGMNVKSVSECAGDMNPYVHAVKSIDLDLGTSIPAAIPNASPGAASLPSGNGGIRLQLNLEIFIFILLFT